MAKECQEQDGIIHTFKKQQDETAKEIAGGEKSSKNKNKEIPILRRTQGEKTSSSEIFPKKKTKTLEKSSENM